MACSVNLLMATSARPCMLLANPPAFRAYSNLANTAENSALIPDLEDPSCSAISVATLNLPPLIQCGNEDGVIFFMDENSLGTSIGPQFFYLCSKRLNFLAEGFELSLASISGNSGLPRLAR